MKIKPIGNRVLIEKIQQEEKTISGIILPSKSKNNSSNTGLVLAIGNLEEDIKIGNTVIFKPYSGIEVIGSESAIYILDVEDIFGIIE
ncbi:MAG: co-chaperone GroES [Psychrilyobacter sp.]|nr:co-chaperone GroES [Psychrilyobacter sp.]